MQIKIESDDPELRNSLQARCDSVIPYFESSPGVRVLAFMAKGDDEQILSKLGRTNRGVHLALEHYYHPYDSRFRDWLKLPDSVTTLLHDENGNLNYDHLVYLHAKTHSHPVGCVLSFAHELQHVRQCEEHHELFADSKQIEGEWMNLLKRKFINFPHEKDAMFASRQIAATICGRGPVSHYINEQLEAARHLSPPEDSHRESVIWSYQAEWADTFSLQDEVESMRRQIQES
jgi:hypothetical protein